MLRSPFTQGKLGSSLPASAHQYQTWWSNPSTPSQHPYAQSWLTAAWRVAGLNQQEAWVRFQRMSAVKAIN